MSRGTVPLLSSDEGGKTMSIIQNIGTEQAAPVANRVATASGLSTHQARAVASGPGSSGQEFIVSLSNEAVDVANIQEAKNSRNDTAKSIRLTDQSIQQINEYVEKMRANLNAIIKQYPPFPPGSEERVSYLRSFNAFRRQIDQLSFNTEDRGAAEILAGSDGTISEGIGVSAEAAL